MLLQTETNIATKMTINNNHLNLVSIWKTLCFYRVHRYSGCEFPAEMKRV